ncbi:uncharacterized protein LOC133730788 [Rosa rugosa]|uniref:uncharacterized protein LOC133730788 n=1 Tax=Rosa rugosa TaxID=74645 RepID=UPI002B4167F7|nr:uncharacterized protein LOC133730788 [Rosa rugosa]
MLVFKVSISSGFIWNSICGFKAPTAPTVSPTTLAPAAPVSPAACPSINGSSLFQEIIDRLVAEGVLSKTGEDSCRINRKPDHEFIKANDYFYMKGLYWYLELINVALMDLRYEMQRATSFVAQAMAPRSINTAKAKAIALRMKALKMKRGKKTVSKPAVEETDAPPKFAFTKHDQ